MRNLDAINFPFMKPSKVATWGPIIPIFAGVFGWLMASETDPGPLIENPLAILSCAILVLACFAILVPILFRWDWRAEYFGAPLIYISSLSLLNIIPFFCLIFYGELQFLVKTLMLAAHSFLHLAWCYRFIVFYRKIFSENDLYSMLYLEEEDVVYYSQRVDEYFYEKLIPFRQIPPNYLFVTCLLLPIIFGVGMKHVREITGFPYIYTLLSISALPISVMCFGLATRGWLIFYCYPKKIRLATGKNVYVDMHSVPKDFKKKIRRWKGSRI